MFIYLIQRGGATHAEIAAGQRRLEHVGRVYRALWDKDGGNIWSV